MRTTLGRITIFGVLLATLVTGLFIVGTWSVSDALLGEPALVIQSADASDINARAVLVFDLETNEVIIAKDADTVLPIASVTKLATAAVFQNIADLNATTTITWSDVNTEGRAGKLHPYEDYTARELLYPLLLESSNDAAVAMLRTEPDLLTFMNVYADSAGLEDTHFADTSGLSDKNVSTARDIAKLSATLFKDQPYIFDITRLTQYIGTYTGWMNNNPFVEVDEYRGGKHGFTYEANRTDVSFFEETFSGGEKRTIGYVILGSDDLEEDMELLREKTQVSVQFE